MKTQQITLYNARQHYGSHDQSIASSTDIKKSIWQGTNATGLTLTNI